MEQIKTLRGVKDIIGADAQKFNYIISVVKQIAQNFAFQTAYFPIIEDSSIYTRTLGMESDIVTKEMYNFYDKGDNKVTLRPEFTAGIVRSLISNNLLNELPIKFFSYGPLFRYERPQHGRQRQFYQLNFEFFGNASYYAELEMILLVREIIQALGLEEKIQLEINSLGSDLAREKYQQALVSYLEQYKDSLSSDSQKRLVQNPLRILDSKNPADQEILVNAAKIVAYYKKSDQEFFDNLLALLEEYKISYKINDKLVRGLDYYTNTVFEFTTTELGSQNAVFAGGRYDNLVKNMGAKEAVPAIGFAAGLERLKELIVDNYKEQKKPIIIVNVEEEQKAAAFSLMQEFRAKNIKVEGILTHHNLGKKLKKTNKYQPELVVILGADEVKNGQLKIKNFITGEDRVIKTDDIYDVLDSKI